ncbi:hypothetical protein ILYODFUR_024233 [Ilyodon furcidens]|uniref:Uncharacterized protein n=1 Tax=Ilyodon furcidens TaxID=33524 RepID=A0ABV0UIP5_9TELE
MTGKQSCVDHMRLFVVRGGNVRACVRESLSNTVCGYVGGISMWVNHLKQTQTDDLPLFSSPSGHFAVPSITSVLAPSTYLTGSSTLELGCLPTQKELSGGVHQ